VVEWRGDISAGVVLPAALGRDLKAVSFVVKFAAWIEPASTIAIWAGSKIWKSIIGRSILILLLGTYNDTLEFWIKIYL
jgi:hypothetical protein